jgi:hypothetical protein
MPAWRRFTLQDVGNALGMELSGVPRSTALSYSASITPDDRLGTQSIVATDTSAFTINAPTAPSNSGQTLSFDIKNSSGGTQGTITWDAAYKLAGAFSNAANTKRRTISFYYDGTNWVELSRAAADI